jgi:hypothetical protein
VHGFRPPLPTLRSSFSDAVRVRPSRSHDPKSYRFSDKIMGESSACSRKLAELSDEIPRGLQLQALRAFPVHKPQSLPTAERDIHSTERPVALPSAWRKRGEFCPVTGRLWSRSKRPIASRVSLSSAPFVLIGP